MSLPVGLRVRASCERVTYKSSWPCGINGVCFIALSRFGMCVLSWALVCAHSLRSFNMVSGGRAGHMLSTQNDKVAPQTDPLHSTAHPGRTLIAHRIKTSKARSAKRYYQRKGVLLERGCERVGKSRIWFEGHIGAYIVCTMCLDMNGI